jgi:hypothetical protein
LVDKKRFKVLISVITGCEIVETIPLTQYFEDFAKNAPQSLSSNHNIHVIEDNTPYPYTTISPKHYHMGAFEFKKFLVYIMLKKMNDSY